MEAMGLGCNDEVLVVAISNKFLLVTTQQANFSAESISYVSLC